MRKIGRWVWAVFCLVRLIFSLDVCTYLDTEAVRSAARSRVLVHRYGSAVSSLDCSYVSYTHRHDEYMNIWYSHLT